MSRSPGLLQSLTALLSRETDRERAGRRVVSACGALDGDHLDLPTLLMLITDRLVEYGDPADDDMIILARQQARLLRLALDMEAVECYR